MLDQAASGKTLGCPKWTRLKRRGLCWATRYPRTSSTSSRAGIEEPQKKKKKKLRRRTIAKPDASVEWQAERAMLAAREAQVIYDGMGWTLRVGSVRLCDV